MTAFFDALDAAPRDGVMLVVGALLVAFAVSEHVVRRWQS